MGSPFKFFLAALLVGFVSSSASACIVVPPRWWENEKVKTAEDCSFTGGGRNDYLIGDAANDLGRGRVYQILHDFTSETAVVTDCKADEQVQIYAQGKDALTSSCDSEIKVVSHLKPNGPVDLDFGQNLENLSSEVRRLGYRVNQRIAFDETGARPRDYPDFYCGCKLYYPDSPGANL
ncbi:hypothetical protein [uncultured Ruegeria sp.]|uniref:hypothetical protein n=1 Tax=uncultured Ruegeria sp. TaxID=259304 RepID=UPI0026214C2F|nr:hypothetical protein [uncultured Ruegeria sp.]